MHNKHAVNRCLIALWLLLPWAATAAVPPPPVVRSVLTTNLPAFGSSGQALFRTANAPYTSWSNSPPSIPISAPTRLVVEGDSTSLSGAPAWPYWLTQTYGLTNGLWVWGTNAASNGATVTNMIAEYAGQIAPWKPAGGTNAILFLWAGINDLAAGASSNDVVRDVSNYCATAKADGFKICLLTIGRSAAVVDAGRVGANEALRFGGFADWVVDAGRMFPPPSSAAAVTNYYIDVTHLSTNAHRLLAAAIRDTLFADDRRGIRYDPWADGNIEGSANISLRSGSKLSIGSTVSGLYGLEVYGNAYFNGNITGDGISTSFSGFRQYDTAGSNYIAGVTYDAGLLGVGTNLPQSRLHVTYDNSVFNGIQWGSTNRPQQGTISTNGVLRVNPGGALNQLGVYAELDMTATNIIVCAGASEVYTNVAGTGFGSMITNGFYGLASQGTLTNLYAGYYRITICMSYLGANSTTYEGAFFTNAVEVERCAFKNTTDNPARMRTSSKTSTVYIPAGTRCSFKVQDFGSGTSVAIHRASLTIGTP